MTYIIVISNTYRCHIEAISVPYHNNWHQYGFDMALIWLRYGFDESHMGILPEFYGNKITCFGEILGIAFPVIPKYCLSSLGWERSTHSSLSFQTIKLQDNYLKTTKVQNNKINAHSFGFIYYDL